MYTVYKKENLSMKTFIFKYCLWYYLLQVDEGLKIRKVVIYLNKNNNINLIKKKKI